MKIIDYTLENITLRHQEDPRHFLKPTDEELASIKIGDPVRLIFLLSEPTEEGCRAERMWLTVTEIHENGFLGKLTNQPTFITTLKTDDTVAFTKDHIATLLSQAAYFDLNQLAIISRKALNAREINYVFRADEFIDEKDSGYQFFFGDEDDAYLADPHHAVLISLEQALSFEPLLETVIGKEGTAYAYDEEIHSFVEEREE
jgi:hypothetical protein